MASKFEPEDFSRFFIREFLKKNNFNKAYACFMEEDSRPPVGGTMNRAVLTELLGIEALNKKNQKTKKYTTMLDMLMNYLQLVKEKMGGVTLPDESSVRPTPAAAKIPPKQDNKLSFYGAGAQNSQSNEKMKVAGKNNAYGSGTASI